MAFPVFYGVCFVVFLSSTFPYGRLKERIVAEFAIQQRATSGNQDLQIEEMSGYWLTGVRAKGIHLVSMPTEPTKSPSDLKIDAAHATISILGLLVGNRDVSFALDAFGGKIHGSFDDDAKQRAVEVFFEDVDLGRIRPLDAALAAPVEGTLTGKILADDAGGEGVEGGDVEPRGS